MNKTLRHTVFGALTAGLSFSSFAQSTGLIFNGSSYASVVKSPALDLGTGTFTVEANFKASSTSGGNTQIFLSNRVSGEVSGLMFGLYGGNLFAQLGGDVPNFVTSGPSLRDDQCHHVAVTRDASGNLAFYVDGQKTMDAVSNSSISSSANFHIGYDARDGRDQFNGGIDEIRVWNVKRSASDIASYSTRSLGSSTKTGLVALWDFNDGQGQTIKDNSGNHLDGVLGLTDNVENIDPTWSTVGCVTDNNGSNGLTFDGTQTASIPASDSLNLGTGPFTFEASIMTTGTSTQMILSNRLASQGVMFGLMSGRLFIQLGGVAPNIGYDQGVTINDGNCHHVAITRNSAGTLTFYLDGVSYYTAASTSSISSTGHFYLSYDARDAKDYFNGSMDEVRIWKIARSANDIATYKNKPIANPATTPGLVAVWDFNEGTGQVAHDGSKNALHAILGTTPNVESTDPTWSPLTCVMGPVTSVENDNLLSASISVYPNPFDAELFITSPLSSLRASFYTSTGELVQAERSVSNGASLQMERELPAGMYVLKVSNGETARYFKVLKK